VGHRKELEVEANDRRKDCGEMTDIIAATDLALKDMTRLWNETLKQHRPDMRPMSYQRFKTLRAVVNGHSTVCDIAEAAGSDLSTTAEQLFRLKDGKYVTREPLDFRTFKWKMTKYGRGEVKEMSAVLDKINQDLINIVKSRMEKWL
jgi:DNA-binding MarR family transcriptional regulator